jgi:hypothetical protein
MNNSVEQLMRTTSAMRAAQLEAALISAVRESASRKSFTAPIQPRLSKLAIQRFRQLHRC